MAMSTASTATSPMTVSMDVRFSPGIFLISTFSVDEQSEDGGEEEEDDIHDAKGEAGFEHGASPVDVDRPFASRAPAPESKGPKSDIEVPACGEVCAVRLGKVSEFDDAGDQSRQEAEIDEGDEDG